MTLLPHSHGGNPGSGGSGGKQPEVILLNEKQWSYVQNRYDLTPREREIAELTVGARHAEIQNLFRRCALAVLNTGNEIDDAAAIFDAYADFSIEVVRRTRGLQLSIKKSLLMRWL